MEVTSTLVKDEFKNAFPFFSSKQAAMSVAPEYLDVSKPTGTRKMPRAKWRSRVSLKGEIDGRKGGNEFS